MGRNMTYKVSCSFPRKLVFRLAKIIDINAHELAPVLSKNFVSFGTIVVVSSNAHFFLNPDDEDDIRKFNDERNYSPNQQYARSKLANVLFAREFSKRLPGNVLINSLNPGAVQMLFF